MPNAATVRVMPQVAVAALAQQNGAHSTDWGTDNACPDGTHNSPAGNCRQLHARRPALQGSCQALLQTLAQAGSGQSPAATCKQAGVGGQGPVVPVHISKSSYQGTNAAALGLSDASTSSQGLVVRPPWCQCAQQHQLPRGCLMEMGLLDTNPFIVLTTYLIGEGVSVPWCGCLLLAVVHVVTQRLL